MKEIEIKGDYENCIGCDFLGHIPLNNYFCGKEGKHIVEIEKCSTGRMASIERLKDDFKSIFRRWDKI